MCQYTRRSSFLAIRSLDCGTSLHWIFRPLQDQFRHLSDVLFQHHPQRLIFWCVCTRFFCCSRLTLCFASHNQQTAAFACTMSQAGSPIRSVPLLIPHTPPHGYSTPEAQAEAYDDAPRLGPTTPEHQAFMQDRRYEGNLLRPVQCRPTDPPERFIWLPRLEQAVPLKTYVLYKADHTGDQLHLGMLLLPPASLTPSFSPGFTVAANKRFVATAVTGRTCSPMEQVTVMCLACVDCTEGRYGDYPPVSTPHEEDRILKRSGLREYYFTGSQETIYPCNVYDIAWVFGPISLPSYLHLPLRGVVNAFYCRHVIHEGHICSIRKEDDPCPFASIHRPCLRPSDYSRRMFFYLFKILYKEIASCLRTKSEKSFRGVCVQRRHFPFDYEAFFYLWSRLRYYDSSIDVKTKQYSSCQHVLGYGMEFYKCRLTNDCLGGTLKCTYFDLTTSSHIRALQKVLGTMSTIGFRSNAPKVSSLTHRFPNKNDAFNIILPNGDLSAEELSLKRFQPGITFSFKDGYLCMICAAQTVVADSSSCLSAWGCNSLTSFEPVTTTPLVARPPSPEFCLQPGDKFLRGEDGDEVWEIKRVNGQTVHATRIHPEPVNRHIEIVSENFAELQVVILGAQNYLEN